MLDRWGELMEAGNYAEVLSLLDAKLAPVPGIPPLDDFLNWVRPASLPLLPASPRAAGRVRGAG